ncbi:hypothetical protein GIB67_025895 [Kingdonia uniflora]|uniref:F-box associated beta-propeller type 3 domain-containing protein n=1 Tax=Kingdonia uniflora TaxID=39325 RepID=A0A7J7LP87_9MAGN|nr:hypothetical protein GIB67_025895 [Kingdonia uniflora]
MIDDPHFAKIYLSLDDNKPMISCPSPSSRFIVLVRRKPTGPLNDELYITEITDEGLVIKATTKIDHPINIYYVRNPSNGLVTFQTSDRRHYICNLATGKCLPIANQPCKRLSIGMGFSLSSREFKVVQVTTNSIVGTQGFHSEFEVVTLGTQERRTVGSLPYKLNESCLYFNGSLHWIVDYDFENMHSESFTMLRIVSFDLDSEAIGEFPKPEISYTSQLDRLKSRSYVLGVLGGYLSLWDLNSYDPLEVWVMKDYKVKESWTVQCVSKPWCHMIDNPRFAKMYLSLDDNKPISTLSNRIMVSLWRALDYERYIAEDTDEGLVIKGAAKIDLPINIYYVQNPSNGLVTLESVLRHYICNPATGKCLPIANQPCKRMSIGMGFSLSKREFKIAQIATYSEVEACTYQSKFEVFILGTQVRRMIGSLPHNLFGSCVYFNGSLHWIVDYDFVNMSSESFTTLRIVSFNLDTETIGEFPNPEISYTSQLDRIKSRTYMLGVLGGYLSLWDFQSSNPLEVWVMKDYKVKESWTKHTLS